jgi:ubiquinone/menaquinone biosynthesis C-methylase UbiE
VLDIGFGGGVAFPALLERVGHGVVAGVEASRDMIDMAQRRFHAEIAAGRLEVKEGRAEALPYADCQFDRILSVNTMYFWPDLIAVFREVRRVLKPGGLFVLGGRPPETMKSSEFTRHVLCYGEKEVTAALEQVGLRLVRIKNDSEYLAGSFKKYGIRAYVAESAP